MVSEQRSSRARGDVGHAVTETTSQRDRNTALDLVRVAFVILLVFKHAWHGVHHADGAVAAASATGVAFMVAFVWLPSVPPTWAMFFVSGAVSNFSLARRPRGDYLRRRLQRLVPPLLLGLVVLLPARQVTSNLVGGRPLGDVYLSVVDLPRVEFVHLWFLFYMLVLSVVLAVVVRPGRVDRARLALRAAIGQSPWASPTLAIGLPASLALAVVGAFADAYLPQGGWKEALIYNDLRRFTESASVFMFGYLIWGDPVLRERYLGDKVALVLVVVGGAAEVIHGWTAWSGLGPVELDWLSAVLHSARRNWVSWAMTGAMLWLAHRVTIRSVALVSYLAAAAYTVYVLQENVAWCVRAVLEHRLDLPMSVSFAALLAIGTIGGTVILYEGIKRVRVLRFLFGLKPRPSAAERR